MPPSTMWQKLCEYLGLPEYEAKVYVSLIEAGVANARTLSLMSGVPRTKVYSVLRKLIDTSLIVEIPEEPRKFTPTPPRTAFESFLRSYQSMTENLLSVISSLDDAFKKAKNGGGPQQGTIWIINGRHVILMKIEEMLSRVKSSVDLVTNENGLIILYKSFNRLFDELAERSVKVRIMTPLNPSNQQMLSELKYVCKVEEVNFQLPLIFLCIDKKQFLLAHLQPDNFSLQSSHDKSIFSDNPVLHEMIDLLMLRKVSMSSLQPLVNNSDKVAQR